MRIIVLECGNIGSVIVEDTARPSPLCELVVADGHMDKATAIVSKLGQDWIVAMTMAADERGELRRSLMKSDVVVSALLGSMGYAVDQPDEVERVHIMAGVLPQV